MLRLLLSVVQMRTLAPRRTASAPYARDMPTRNTPVFLRIHRLGAQKLLSHNTPHAQVLRGLRPARRCDQHGRRTVIRRWYDGGSTVVLRWNSLGRAWAGAAWPGAWGRQERAGLLGWASFESAKSSGLMLSPTTQPGRASGGEPRSGTQTAPRRWLQRLLRSHCC
jgi:hypothetical protein